MTILKGVVRIETEQALNSINTQVLNATDVNHLEELKVSLTALKSKVESDAANLITGDLAAINDMMEDIKIKLGE